MEKELSEIIKKLDVISNKREYPNSVHDIDTVCEKLDTIIDLLKNYKK